MALVHGAQEPLGVRDGLVLYLDAANKRSYPGTGTSWFDRSGNGNNGTLGIGTQAPTYSSDNFGSIVFDGNDLISIPHSSSISFPTALTISIWFYSGTVGLGAHLYLKGRTDIDNYNPLIYNTGRYAWTGANGRAMYTSPVNYIQQNTWYNLTVSHISGSTPNIYKNSVLSTLHTFTEGTGSHALGTNTNPVGINADIPRGIVTNFDGRIPLIQAYNRALTEAEVSQNFNALRGRYSI